ncbi:uncharacterized protein LOC143297222 [Babylonia areolata]|uniref:uncharacterized protein LOC143297222 n=1 Tax=Babylonia areolata TaxID=304850 RepID=UPI003FD135F1
MAKVTKCDSHTVTNLKTHLSEIYKVIDAYRWIIEAYVSDFYVKDHWSRLPPPWQQFLETADFSTLSCLLTGRPWCSATTGCSVGPLSLLALKAFTERRAMSRSFVDMDDPCVAATVSQTLNSCEFRAPPDPSADQLPENASCTHTDRTLGFKNGQLMEMEHIFRKHVKPKKQHEIRQLGKVVQLVTQVSGSDHVVDVGAGLGHLSRLLTFAHGLKVTTVEAAGGHAPKASEFDRELKKDIQKKLKRREPSDPQERAPTYATPTDLPNHVVCRVEPNISTEDFLALVLQRGCDTPPSPGTQVTLSSHNSTQSCLKSGSGGGDVSMDCGDSSSVKQCEEKQETAASWSCSNVLSAVSRDQSVSHVGSKAAVPSVSVSSGETDAKVSRQDWGFQSCWTGDREGGSSGHNEGWNSQLSGSCGVMTGSENAEWKRTDQADIIHSNKSSSENKSLMTDSLNDDRKTDLSDCERKILLSHTTEGSEEQSQMDQSPSEHSNKISLTQNQHSRERQSVENVHRHSMSGHNIEMKSAESEQKEVLAQNVELPSGTEHDSVSCGNRKMLSAANKCREPSEHKESACDENENGRKDLAQNVEDSLVTEGQCSGGEGGAGKGRRGMVLAGLHACGDLTATLLRVFVNCPAVSALVSVGCCYMKLSAHSEDDEAHCEKGYPMSQFVQSLSAHPLTYEAREMACHFADAYAQRLLDNPPHLKIHSYRAALQYVVTSIRPDFVPGAARLIVKKGAEIPFPQYAGQCLQRLGISVSEVPHDVMATAESMTTHWRRVVAFYTLRLSLAPLVETALLLDRMLFMYEQGISSVAVPVFDSTLSPRNFALLACKPQTTL